MDSLARVQTTLKGHQAFNKVQFPDNTCINSMTTALTSGIPLNMYTPPTSFRPDNVLYNIHDIYDASIHH